jgi:hypothetical protein
MSIMAYIAMSNDVLEEGTSMRLLARSTETNSLQERTRNDWESTPRYRPSSCSLWFNSAMVHSLDHTLRSGV